MKKLLILIIILAAGYWVYANDRAGLREATGGLVGALRSVGADSTPAVSDLYGVWQSDDDPNAFIGFTEDGSFVSVYGIVQDTGTWRIDDEEEDFVLLRTTMNGETFEYSVIELTPEALALGYLARGNTLHYSKVSDAAGEQESGAVVPEGWQMFASDEYGFSIAYPSDWEAQEMLKPRDERALHEVSIHEKEYDMWRGELAVRIYTNDEHISAVQWLDALLAEEETKEAQCRAENGDQAPCLFLNGRLTSRASGSVAGVDAETVAWFSFDHQEVCDYIAGDAYIYALCAEGGDENPNDPNFATHKEITTTMRDSFELK